MSITPINSTNSQPNFNGYVDPKLIDLIKKSANGAIKRELELGGFASKVINDDTVKTVERISKRADKFISTLENSGIKDLHPDTCITYTQSKNPTTTYDKNVNLVLTNPKIKKSLKIGNLIDYSFNSYLFQKDSRFNPEILDNTSLKKVFNQFIRFFNIYQKFTPEILKKEELKMFTQFTDGGKIPFLRHRKANKLAPEFGLPSNWTEVLKEKRAKEKLKKELALKLEKEEQAKKELEAKKREEYFENQNMKLVKKYMK